MASIVFVHQSQSPIYLIPAISPWCPCTGSLHLSVYLWFSSMIVCTISLASMFIADIQYVIFSFWLTSLCMTVSRSIHVSRNDGSLFEETELAPVVWRCLCQMLFVGSPLSMLQGRCSRRWSPGSLWVPQCHVSHIWYCPVTGVQSPTPVFSCRLWCSSRIPWMDSGPVCRSPPGVSTGLWEALGMLSAYSSASKQSLLNTFKYFKLCLNFLEFINMEQ